MGGEYNLVVIEGPATETVQLSRRAMVQRLVAAMSAGAAWPLVAGSHPVFELLRSGALQVDKTFFENADQLAEANWKPAFLSSQQNELLTALAESIVPGSTRAHVSRFVDLLLSVDKPENQRKFTESLAALDAEAQKQFRKSFPVLDEEQKNTFLTDASTNPLPSTAGGKPSYPDVSQTEAEKFAPYSHFENLKGWVSAAYYSSEVGMRELGWTGDYAFAAFPGCTHPEGHS